jgi:hypothetical protein
MQDEKLAPAAVSALPPLATDGTHEKSYDLEGVVRD